MQNQIQKKPMNGVMKGCLIASVVLLAMGIFIVLFTIWGFKTLYNEVSEEFTKEVEHAEAALLEVPEEKILNVSLNSLSTDFKSAPLEAAKKYQNQVLKVSGIVGKHVALPFNLPVDYFILTSKEHQDVYLFCGVTGKHKAKIESLKVGSQITILGKYRDAAEEEKMTFMFWPCTFAK